MLLQIDRLRRTRQLWKPFFSPFYPFQRVRTFAFDWHKECLGSYLVAKSVPRSSVDRLCCRRTLEKRLQFWKSRHFKDKKTSATCHNQSSSPTPCKSMIVTSPARAKSHPMFLTVTKFVSHRRSEASVRIRVAGQRSTRANPKEFAPVFLMVRRIQLTLAGSAMLLGRTFANA